MSNNELRELLVKSAQLSYPATVLLAELSLAKQAMVPMPQGQPPMPPMDPMAGGMPPMDPAMGGMPPMDPMMGGGMPPMDPMAGGMPPMDPAMGGMPADPAAAMGGLGGAGPLPPEQLENMPGGIPGGAGDPAAAEASLKDELTQMIDQKFEELMSKIPGAAPAGGGAGAGGGKAKVEDAIAKLTNSMDKMMAYVAGKEGKPMEEVMAEDTGAGPEMDPAALAAEGVSSQGVPKMAMVTKVKSDMKNLMDCVGEYVSK